MGQKIIIRFRWESALSSASRNHLTTFCRSFVHHACLRLCSAIVHFILSQGGPRLRAWRVTLWFEETFAGRKERNFIAIAVKDSFAVQIDPILLHAYRNCW